MRRLPHSTTGYIVIVVVLDLQNTNSYKTIRTFQRAHRFRKHHSMIPATKSAVLREFKLLHLQLIIYELVDVYGCLHSSRDTLFQAAVCQTARE